jgi:hypothetical protein
MLALETPAPPWCDDTGAPDTRLLEWVGCRIVLAFMSWRVAAQPPPETQVVEEVIYCGGSECHDGQVPEIHFEAPVVTVEARGFGLRPRRRALRFGATLRLYWNLSLSRFF